MLIFDFELQGEIKSYLIKKQKRGMVIVALITALLFFIPALIIGIIWYKNPIALLISIGLFIFSILFFICFSLWNNPFNAFYKSIPDKITIDEKDGIIETTGIGQYSYKCFELSEIKEIMDFGSWYEIRFYYPKGSMFFICQKDLIVEGSIEQFEKLFKEKIINKKACYANKHEQT